MLKSSSVHPRQISLFDKSHNLLGIKVELYTLEIEQFYRFIEENVAHGRCLLLVTLSRGLCLAVTLPRSNLTPELTELIYVGVIYTILYAMNQGYSTSENGETFDYAPTGWVKTVKTSCRKSSFIARPVIQDRMQRRCAIE